MDEEIKKKNILDLQFQKYLIIASTSVIIGFTYLIGVMIAMMTKQIILENYEMMLALFFISTVVIGVCSVFLLNSIFHLRIIPDIIKEL
ncbi:hypothetical protein COU57_04710 [Candidatus Pacearchaeota archaeon CG10_big_fil_rev_8_21_14_0_10_32_14]|nr:MAG: hypothetical protein COU57_04710 [Candidatus Pacearchaeota archaeon CG10_big_fil_rev_8_21_14_0_10_32_14]